MIRSLRIYIYALLLIIDAGFKLRKVKKRMQNPELTTEEIFSTPKIVSQKVIKTTKSEVHVSGQEKLPDGAVLFVENHQGLFDILALLGCLGKPIGFIAKKETQRLPIIST